jgi:hypothetical protein
MESRFVLRYLSLEPIQGSFEGASQLNLKCCLRAGRGVTLKRSLITRTSSSSVPISSRLFWFETVSITFKVKTADSDCSGLRHERRILFTGVTFAVTKYRSRIFRMSLEQMRRSLSREISSGVMSIFLGNLQS